MTRVALFSDTHLTAEPQHGPPRGGELRPEGAGAPDDCLEQAVRAVARLGAPDVVVHPGDISEDGSVEACQRARDTLATLGAPVFAVPGNHDIPSVVDATFGSARTMMVDRWRLVGLDTVIAGGTVAGRVDVGHVEAVLGPDDGEPTMLVLHHPPLTVSTKDWFQLADAPALVAMLAGRCDVRAVVSGHVHRHFHVQLGPTAYLGCPSTWYAIEHHGERVEFNRGTTGALVIDLTDTVEWQVVSIGRTGADHP